MALDAQSRRRNARVFFLVTGDRRLALETSDLEDAAWASALRLRMRGRRRTGVEALGLNRRAWLSNAGPPAGPPTSSISPDWIAQALASMDNEQRAWVVVPALDDDGEHRLAGLLGCSRAQAAARRKHAIDRLYAAVAEADADRVASGAPILPVTALADALTEVADRALAEAGAASPACRGCAWIRRAVMLIIAALVLAPGVTQRAPLPPGITWVGTGEIELADGRLRRAGRGRVVEAMWSPDGARIVLAATTGIYGIEAATLRPIGYATTEPGTRLLGFDPDGSRIATWFDGALVVRDVTDLRPVFTAASSDWRSARAAAWDWTSETLALAWPQGVRLVRPHGERGETYVPTALQAERLHFSPDGAWLAITTASPETLLLKTDATRMLEMDGNEGQPIATAFSDNGRRLVGIFANGIGVADLDQGTWTRRSDRSGLSAPVWVSSDGKRAVVAESAAVADVAGLLTLDLETGQVIRQLRVPRNQDAAMMAVRRDGARALIVNSDGLSIWDLNTGALVAASVDFAPPRGLDLPTPVRFAPDGRRLAAPSAYGGLRVLDAVSGRADRALNENTEPFVDVAFSPDGQRIVVDNDAGVGLRRLAQGDRTRQQDPALYAFDVGSGLITHIFIGSRQPQFVSPTVVAYLPAERNELRAYDFSNGRNQAWAGVRGTRLDAFVASSGATRIAVLTDRTLELWDAGTGLVWRAPLSRTDVDRQLLGRSLAMAGDGRIIAVAEPSLGIRVFAGDTGALRGVLARPITVTFDASLENPLKVAISADGRWIASVDNRPTPANTPATTLTLWRADTLRAFETHSDFPAQITGIDFSPDSRRLALIRSDYVIELIALP